MNRRGFIAIIGAAVSIPSIIKTDKFGFGPHRMEFETLRKTLDVSPTLQHMVDIRSMQFSGLYLDRYNNLPATVIHDPSDPPLSRLLSKEPIHERI